jgi:hypothetical protein
MREIRSSGSVQGVMSDHDSYCDCGDGPGRRMSAQMLSPGRVNGYLPPTPLIE